MSMNVDLIVPVPVAGVPNLLANVVGQQIGSNRFEQLRIKITQPFGSAPGDLLVDCRASGRVLKDQSVVPIEQGAAGVGATTETPYFVNEVVQLGEQIFLRAANTTLATMNIRVQATSEAI